MSYIIVSFFIIMSTIHFSHGDINTTSLNALVDKVLENDGECKIKKCPVEGQSVACGFDAASNSYKMFPSKCALTEYSQCYQVVYAETPLEFCVKEHNKEVISRRMYGESCPVFCPSHWRPVCGASKFKSYIYRTFNNGCYMDMLNCRGEDEDLGYVEVPLEYCQRHMMKNMFKEQVLVSNLPEYRDYE